MLETLHAIKKLLNEDKIKLVEDSKITIEETHRQATLRKVEVASVGTETFSIRLEKCGFSFLIYRLHFAYLTTLNILKKTST